MKKCLLVICPVIALSGCAATWEPLGSPALVLQEAKNLCEATSLSQFPIKNEVATRSVEKQVTIKCKKNDADCTSSGYKYENKLGVESYPLDVNINSREKAFLACMEKNGWHHNGWF